MTSPSRTTSTSRPDTPIHEAASGAAVEAVGLIKRFGGFTALDGLDLHVDAGEVCGFLGPNGAGKSTTIRILLGMHHRDAGRVRVLGLDPGVEPAEVTRQVSYVPGDVALWPALTGQQVLDTLAGLRGRDRYDPGTERRLVRAFALDASKKVRTYSKGNRQKVALVAAFAARTPLLILDEPTSGLDPVMEDVFQECVRDAACHGRSVLLSSHILSQVQNLCDTVAIIKDGRLVESGRLADLRHLAASRITARLSTEAAARFATRPPAVVTSGSRQGVPLIPAADGTIQIDAPGIDVNHVLHELLRLDATDITCQPATLDDLFLRYYQDRTIGGAEAEPDDQAPTHPATEAATPERAALEGQHVRAIAHGDGGRP